jgi:hypothetical protein
MLLEHRGIHVTDDWLRDVAGAHRTTVARWRAAQRLPRAVSLLVAVMHHGELELVHDAWRGYRLDRRDGTLWTPTGWPCRPGDIAAIQYRLAQVRALELELARSRLTKRASRGRDDEKAEHGDRAPRGDGERPVGRRRLAELGDDAARLVDGQDVRFDPDPLEQPRLDVARIVDRRRRRDRRFDDDAQPSSSSLGERAATRGL